MKTQESGQAAGSNPATQSTHLFAYTVEEYDAGNGKKARSWTRIGAAFPHKEGPGFNIELKSIPLDGRIVLLPPDESSNASDGGTDDDASHNRGGNGNGPRRSR
jgi:hypothetical protein